MKILIVLLSMFTFVNLVQSQTSFEIIQEGNTYTTQEINEAFASANFCGAHFESKRNSITLDDGAKIELLSAFELGNLESTCILSDDATIAVCEYGIVNGIIVKKYVYEPSDQKKKELLNK